MKRNRKVPKKMSAVVACTMYAGAVMLTLFVMVIVNLLASSSCGQLERSTKEKERQLERLEDERQRESARWEQMKTPERLEMALRRMGLAMRFAHAEQVIYMTADGQPKPAQISVALAQRRLNEKGMATASVRTNRSRRR